MTITQILNLARKKILEISSEIFSDDDLLLYANNGKDELAMRYLGKRLVKPATLTFTNGVATKPTDWNGHYYTASSDTPNQGNEFHLVSIDDFQNGAKSHMICESEGNILVFPTNTASAYTWYYKKLTDMDIDPVIVNPPAELNDLFHMALVYYIVSQALEDAQDFELSKYFNDKYETQYESKAQIISELEKGTQGGGSLLNPLPDLNFGGYSSSNQDPNRF